MDIQQDNFKSRFVNKVIGFAKKNKDNKTVEFFNIADFADIKYRTTGDKNLIFHTSFSKVKI